MGFNGNYVGISCGNVDLMGCNGNIIHIGNFLRQGMDRHFPIAIQNEIQDVNGIVIFTLW